MTRSPQAPPLWVWMALVLTLLLLPGPAGRFVLDVLGGITLTLLLLPLLLAGIGVVAWQILRRRLHTCSVCGLTSLADSVCPACGAPFADSAAGPAASVAEAQSNFEVDASQVTIDVQVTQVDD